ncbi:hypothetical protein B0H16DRAFT_1516306 [Mycena metata]|uniref:Uncharacterized protein n=1 Tax=Mycena metata TaxID=1033252 RepID=A0AAD7JRZ7_9AGAR|nr:hypothetical protein B0H16DRAFT_1516306 [Mycena metata]
MLGWFSGRSSPPLIDLSATSSGSNPHSDSLHNDPRRHRFVKLTLPGQMKSNLSGEGNTSEPIIPVKPEPISSASTLRNSKAKARDPTPEPSKPKVLLEMLEEELAGLFAQTLPETNFESLITMIKLVAEESRAPQDIADVVTTLVGAQIRGEHLPNKQHTDLIDTVVARVFNYTLNKGVHHTSSGRAHPSPFLSQTPAGGKAPASTNRAGKAPVQNEPNISVQLSINSNSKSFRAQSSQGTFHWYSTKSDYDLDSPVEVEHTLNPGDFFFHTNTTLTAPDTPQVWVYNKEKQWEDITDIWAAGDLLVHPTLPDRVLTIHDDQTPNWVLKATLAQKRRSQSQAPASQSASTSRAKMTKSL